MPKRSTSKGRSRSRSQSKSKGVRRKTLVRSRSVSRKRKVVRGGANNSDSNGLESNRWDKYRVISDPEGFDIYDMIEKEKQNEFIKTEKILVCGDILDSTVAGNIKELLNLKSNNLKNIHTVLTNPNVRLILGNRDINKIKCRSLASLKLQTPLAKKYNEGEISFTDYNSLKAELSGNKNPWICSMNNWYTFWNPSPARAWNKEEDYSNNPFLRRFEDIFGVDGSLGTMSAGNLLHTIPNELGIQSDSNDEKAFIVLSVFLSMTLPRFKYIKLERNKSFSKATNTSYFKGWISQMFAISKVCDYQIRDDKVLFFSHGGIPYELIKNPGILDDFKEKLGTNLYYILTDFKELREKYSRIKCEGNTLPFAKIESETPYSNIPKKGGAGNVIDENNIKTNISIINEKFQNCMTAVANVTDIKPKPSTEALFLLALTSNFSINSKLFCSYKKTKGNAILAIKDAIDISPVAPGLNNMKTRSFAVNGKTTYQIFGHVPSGYGTVISKIEGSFTSYLINLDNSNSFMGSPGHRNTTQKSYNFVKVNNGDIKIESELVIKVGEWKQLLINGIANLNQNSLAFSKTTNTYSDSFYYAGQKPDKKVTISQDIKDLDEDILSAASAKNLSYHGQTTDGYHVFTLAGGPGQQFKKNLYLIEGKPKIKEGNWNYPMQTYRELYFSLDNKINSKNTERKKYNLCKEKNGNPCGTFKNFEELDQNTKDKLLKIYNLRDNKSINGNHKRRFLEYVEKK